MAPQIAEFSRQSADGRTLHPNMLVYTRFGAPRDGAYRVICRRVERFLADGRVRLVPIGRKRGKTCWPHECYLIAATARSIDEGFPDMERMREALGSLTDVGYRARLERVVGGHAVRVYLSESDREGRLLWCPEQVAEFIESHGGNDGGDHRAVYV